MAFGQSSGPPATARQVQQLTLLVQAAGHADLRDARGPLGLTQRQSAGRFTRDEAEALIAQLEVEIEIGAEREAQGASPPDGRAGEPAAAVARTRTTPARDRREAVRA